MSFKKQRIIGYLAAVLCLANLSARAANITWSGTSSNVWNNSGNWTGTNTPPISNDSLIFATSSFTNLNNDLTNSSFNIAGITFNAGASALVIGDGTATANAGNAFVLTGDVTNSGSNLEIINCPFSMAATRTFTMTSNITIGGNISGTGGGISTARAGTTANVFLTFLGANSYTGLTSVGAGTVLNIQNNSALGTTGAGTTVAAGGTLQLQGDITVTGEDLTLTPVASSSNLQNGLSNSSGNNEWAGTISCNITSGNANNVRINSAGGNLKLSGNVSITTATGVNGNSLVLRGASTGEISGVLAVAANCTTAVIHIDAGTWKLSGANSYPGKTDIAEGAISVSSINRASGGTATSNLGTPTSAAAGALEFGLNSSGSATTGTLIYTGSGETTDRNINLISATTGGGKIQADNSSGLLKFTGAVTTTSGNGTKTLTLQGSGAGEIAGVLSNGTNPLALTKSSSSIWTVSNANTYTGVTSVSGGTLAFSTIQNVAGSTANNLGQPSSAANGIISLGAATLQFIGSTSQTSDRVINLTGNGTIDSSGTGGATLTLNNATNAVTGNTFSLTLTGSSNGSIGLIATTTGGVTKSGAGTWTLTGTNTFTGTTSISQGTLVVASTGSLASTSSLNIANATFDPRTSAGIRSQTVKDVTLNNATITVGMTSTSNDTITSTGTASISGTNVFKLYGSLFDGSNYVLFAAATGTTLMSSNFSIDTSSVTASSAMYSATTVGNKYILTVTGNPGSSSIYYLGNVNNNWSATPTTNWCLNSDGTGPSSAVPNNTSDVIFAAAGVSNPATTLGADFSIKSLTFSSAGTFSVDGSNGLTVVGLTAALNSVEVGNGANVTLSVTSSTWTNPTSVASGGTLTVGNSNAIGSATGSLVVNGTLNLDNSLTKGDFSGSGTVTRSVAGSSTLMVGTATSKTFSGVISDGSGVVSLTKQGAGILTLSGTANNTFTGTTTVSAGNLTLNKSNNIVAIGGDLQINSGAKLVYTSGGNNQIADTANVSMSGAGSTFNGTGNNTGLVNITDTFASLTVTGGSFNAGTASPGFNVTGLASFTGGAGNPIFVGNSGFQMSVGGLSLTAMTATPGGTVNTPNSFAVYGNSTTRSKFAVGSLGLTLNNSTLNLRRAVTATGNAGSRLTLEGDVMTTGSAACSIKEDSFGGVDGLISLDLAATTTTGAVTRNFNIGSGADLTVSVPIKNGANVGAGAAGITKTGVGTLTITAVTSQAHGYTGVTTVSTGTLIVNGNIATSTQVSVSSGATLRGNNGTVSAITGTGLVYPGTSYSANLPMSADETLNGTSLDINAGGTLGVQVSYVGGIHKQSLVLTGAATLGGMSKLVVGAQAGANLSSYGSADIVILQTAADGILDQFGSFSVPSGFSLIYTRAGADTMPDGNIVNAADKVVLRPSGTTVTPVKISDFAAKAEGAGVNVSWKAVSEYQNAGFNVYRRSSEGGEWTLVNPALIAGRVTNPDELKYTYFDWASAGEWQYKLESIDLSGGKEVYEQFAGPVGLDWNADLSVAADVDVGSVSSVNEGFVVMAGVRNARAVSATVASMKQDAVELNKVAVREVTAIATSVKTNSNLNVAARSLASSAPSISSSLAMSNVGVRWFSSGKISGSTFSAAKLTYITPGVMIIPQVLMPNGYDLNSVSLQREGRNMSALAKVPTGLLVYAPGYADDYTDKDAVFIRKTSAATNVVSAPTSTGLFNSSAPVNVSSPATVTNDYHDVYFDYSSVYRPFSFAPWFSSKYLTQGTTQNFTVTLPQASSSPAKLTVNLWSLTSDAAVNPDHALQLVVNGTIVADTSWDGGNKMMQLSFDVPSGVLNSGDNTVSLVTPTLANVTSQVCFVHSISADYTRLLDGSKSFEIVNNSGKVQLYELNNVPATGAWVVDTRFSDRASLVASETVAQLDGTLRLRFMASAGGSGKFVVTPVGQENAPISITSRLVKAAKLTGTYLATGPLQFASGTQPLLTKRSKEGIRGAYFDQEQLFDYYNYGRYGPDGIRKAVRSLKPKYLLLVGRTTYDYRNYEGKNIDPLCPAYLVSTSFWAQTTSDSLFGDLGRGYPEVAVGRLPINNTTELSGAISHILGYTGIPQSGLRLHAVADQADPLSADFGAQLDTLIKAYNPDVTWQENYLKRTYQTSPEVTDALKAAANGGADLILYSGHGNAARLGNNAPNILDQTSVQQWTGNTVFLQSTCTANWMAKNVDDYKSIAIQALTQSQGGISASIATSTYMNPEVATEFMNQLIKNTNQSNARWGNVLLSTQQWAGRQTTGNGFYTDLMNTEQLFGDPAMPVFAPKSINTAPSNNNSDAGTPVGTF